MKSYSTNFSVMNKMVLRLAFILAGLCMLSLQEASATHIVGGNLTYRCLGNNLYEIRLTVRRDCLNGAPNAQFDDPASIGFFDAVTMNLLTFPGVPNGQILIPVNNNDTLNEILVSDCSVISGDVCVHTTTYVTTVALPKHPNGYIIAYQRCCRNGTINNLLEPLETGMTLSAELSFFAQDECNSSPQFRAFPPIYTCVNKELIFDHRAIDPEGDSLVYSLCTPDAGAEINMNRPQPPFPPPFPKVVYRAPYSLANLMGGVPLTINSSNGELKGTPNTIGQFVVGICVEAYKNGRLTGVTRRDFQFNVRPCRDVPVAAFTAPPLTCDGLTINFNNQSQLADEYFWIFDYGNPNSATSTETEPTYTYPEPGFYNVALIANDQDSFCLDTVYQQVGVFVSELQSDFTYAVSSCTEDGIVLNVTDLSSGFFNNCTEAQYEWLLTVNEQVLVSSAQNPTFNFDIDDPSTVFIAMIVTDCNGCSASVAKTFPVREFSLQFNPEADSICRGDTAILLLNGDCTLDYTWALQSGLSTGPPFSPCNPGAYPGISATYHVTVTDGLCVVSDSVHVSVQQLPALAFDYATDCKSLVVSFDNTTTGGVLYEWNFGDGTAVSLEEDPTHTYTTPGNYTVTLSSRDGCDVKLETTITANAILEELDDTTVNCFQDSIELNPVNIGTYTYIWSPAEFLGPGGVNSSNPTAGVENDTEFFVTITQAGLEGCEIVDSITVLVPDEFNVNAGGDQTLCSFDTITLTGAITGITNGNEMLLWTDEDGNPLSVLTTLEVSPDTTNTYTFTVTDSLGCKMSDQVTIYRPSPEDVLEIVSSVPPTYCDIQTVTLTVNELPFYDYEWFNANMDPIADGLTTDVTPGEATCFRVIATDTLGCEIDDIICLTPTVFEPDVTADQTICDEDVETLSVTGLGGQNATYLWSPGNENTSSITVDPAVTTEYSVIVTNPDVGCTDTLYTTVTVSLFDPLVISITPSEDTITITDDVTLTVNQDAGNTYVWSATAGDTPDPVYNPTITPPETVTYTVTVTNEDGCTGTASITITVRNPQCDESDIFLPRAFTPNGDGVNDELFVRSQFIQSMELIIYNRWGEEVFKTNSQLIPWDGTYKGKRLQPDVFGYYLMVTCPGEEMYMMKGNITLLE